MSTDQRNEFFVAMLAGMSANPSCAPVGETMRTLWMLADMAVYHKERRESPQQMAIRWIKKNYVIVDTETTGLGHDAQIVEIAVIDLKGNVLVNTLVKPTIAIPAEATAVHGITDAMVAGAPSWSDVLPKVVEAIGDTWIAYNAAFDKRMIEQESGALLGGYSSVTLGSLCAMQLYAEYNGEWNTFRRCYQWKKLIDAATALNAWPEATGDDVPHRALFDCRLTLGVIHAIAGAAL
ncbi:3'-5' exonuclease [Lelliottia sp. V106_10]|uniref:3'-5' exonuclease n=1 Tax=Lelliottia wanjuensis TaxID=3050585 RepID=UPI0025512DB1|nr:MULTISPECIES: 3'-5' exonuclease [unclassified Lelliottia]MDK9375832.1 3'-5' exonuclease [Lelliottia sp. V106_10]MDK9602382.1 3'-5' exonuclease [Lelliottia sp. V106_5]